MNARLRDRLHRYILIGSTLLGSWLGMQAVHELGHVLGAWATGGRVERVVLHPLTISRTDLARNPRPLLVVWAGPMVGAILPLLVWRAFLQTPGACVLRFFAGFCLLANGLYIGVGSLDQVGDCREMLRHGSQAWQLWLFAIATAPAGLMLWHGQGRHFGIGPTGEPVSHRLTYTCLAICLGLVILGVTIGGR